MFFSTSYTTNRVKIAVSRIGGPTKAALAAGVSNATIHNWIKLGRIKDIDKAKILAKLAKMPFQDLRGTTL
jgi:hypothetical protein